VLRGAEKAIAIAVTDTGIGIPQDKQKLIFEAFPAGRRTTSRKYGGTGLGLSISREIARLLRRRAAGRSVPGEGSTFTLFVPLQAISPAAAVSTGGTTARYDNSGAVVPSALPTTFEVSDDRDAIGNDAFVLIVEDDPTFASILLDLAHEAGLKGVVSTAGAGTLAMARKLQPNAITLDLGLSDIDGFVLLDLLKHDPLTSHLPIHVISGADKVASVMDMGAFGVTEKPGPMTSAGRSDLPSIQSAKSAAAQASHAARTTAPARRSCPSSRREDPDRRRRYPDDIYSLTSVLGELRCRGALNAERGARRHPHPRGDARHRHRASSTS
jgi:CheY-like chemotaxis protein